MRALVLLLLAGCAASEPRPDLADAAAAPDLDAAAPAPDADPRSDAARAVADADPRSDAARAVADADPMSDAASDAGVPLDSGADDASGPPDLAARGYCEAVADAYCRFYLRCGRVAAPDHASCLAYFSATCEGRFEPRYAALEAAGLLALSAPGVAACAAHLDQVACEAQLLDLDGPCRAMWQGRVPAGGPCGLDIESFVCAAGSACVLDLSLCGTCRPLAGPGEACGPDLRCPAEAECVEDRCVARPRVGEACGDGPRCVLGASCVEGRCQGPTIALVGAECDAGRRCPYGATCVGGACVAGGGLGDGCAPARPCAVGRCGIRSVCEPLLGVGARCGSSLDCRDGPCVDGACAALPGACFDR